MTNCKICGKQLTGNQRSYCCEKCAEEGNRRNALARKLLSSVETMLDNSKRENNY